MLDLQQLTVNVFSMLRQWDNADDRRGDVDHNPGWTECKKKTEKEVSVCVMLSQEHL